MDTTITTSSISSEESILSAGTLQRLNSFADQFKAFAVRDAEEEEQHKDPVLDRILHTAARTAPIVAGYLYFAAAWAVLSVYTANLVSVCLSARTDDLYSYWPLIILSLLGVAVFAFSTAFSYWNYGRPKVAFCVTFIALTVSVVIRIVYVLDNALLVPLLLIPSPNSFVTAAKWMFLIRVLTIVPVIGAGTAVSIKLCRTVFDDMTFCYLDGYRITTQVDFRTHKKNRYDVKIVNRYSSRRGYTIRQNDRFQHSMVVGATGTAKSTNVDLTMISGDLHTRVRNTDALKTQLVKLCRSGDLKISRPLSDSTFSLDYFEIVTARGRKKVAELSSRYENCGMTIIAPDDSLPDSAYALFKTQREKCNRVDPITTADGSFKDGFIGFNPLYISPLIPAWDYKKEVASVASSFAFVLQAIFDLKGKGDPYFTALNNSITTAVTTCLICTMPIIGHRPATVADVQACINSFPRIKPYYDCLVAENAKDPDDTFGFVCDFISYEMLGAGRDDLMKQGRGLRNILDQFLKIPNYKHILCPKPGEPSIDMDRMLSEGQLTVFNTAEKLSSADAKGFGMFFLLNFINAVARRDGHYGAKTTPHFLIVDELPTIIIDDLTRLLNMGRKDKVGFVGTIQDVSQLERVSDTLKKDVLQACAHHFIFRSGLETMKAYCELAGLKTRMEKVETDSETPLSTETPMKSHSTRYTKTQINVLEESEIHNLNFQQIYMFSVCQGNVIPPFKGRVNFLSDADKKPVRRPVFDWDALYRQYGTAFVPPSPEDEEDLNDRIRRANSSITAASVFSATGTYEDNGVIGPASETEAGQQEGTGYEPSPSDSYTNADSGASDDDRYII